MKKLKGKGRPIVNEEDRAYIIASLECVDVVCLFDEETPAEIIDIIKPDILVKGGDYNIDEIVGRESVWENGGEVVTIPLLEGKSTSGIIEKIIKSNISPSTGSNRSPTLVSTLSATPLMREFILVASKVLGFESTAMTVPPFKAECIA